VMPGTSGIHHGCRAGLEAVWVRVNAVIPVVDIWNARAGVHVNMDIHQTGDYVQSPYVHQAFRGRRRNLIGYRRDLPVANTDVADRVNPVSRVDDVTALQHQVVLRLRHCWERSANRPQRNQSKWTSAMIHSDPKTEFSNQTECCASAPPA